MDKSFLTEHPNFILCEEEEYFYEEEKMLYALRFDLKATEKTTYPVTWREKPSKETSIWEAPHWFQTLFYKANKLYHKKKE